MVNCLCSPGVIFSSLTLEVGCWHLHSTVASYQPAQKDLSGQHLASLPPAKE